MANSAKGIGHEELNLIKIMNRFQSHYIHYTKKNASPPLPKSQIITLKSGFVSCDFIYMTNFYRFIMPRMNRKRKKKIRYKMSMEKKRHHVLQQENHYKEHLITKPPIIPYKYTLTKLGPKIQM